MRTGVLIVEDDEVVRNILYTALASAGLGVKVAPGVAEAEKILAAEKSLDGFCCVVDIRLREQNGVEFTRELIARHPGIRVLLISGYADGMAVLELEASARIAFLPKPFTKQDLLDSLKNLCG